MSKKLSIRTKTTSKQALDWLKKNRLPYGKQTSEEIIRKYRDSQ